MEYKVLVLNIFDEKIKEIICSKTDGKTSSNYLNKLVVLLKYFILHGCKTYHFKKNSFINQFVAKDNRTINKMLDKLVASDLITYEMKPDESNPVVSGYSINPAKVIKFVDDLEREYSTLF